MCLIIFGYRAVPGYRLVMAANRDEFHERPSLPADFWGENSDILAGKDLVAGGTWLGVTKTGRFAALTNYRDMKNHTPGSVSRGVVVRNYLESMENPEAHLGRLQNKAGRYDGYNLLAGTPAELYHFSNRGGRPVTIEPGIHGISNALLNTPWPKVEHSKKKLREQVKNGSLTEAHLFDILANTETSPLETLPDTGLKTEMEKAASAAFILTPDYGTRCSTVVFIRDDGNARFVERVFVPGTTKVKEENGFDFSIQPG